MEREWNVRADELAREAYADGEPTAWFDRLYAAGDAGEVTMPWDRDDPQPLLAEWAEARDLRGDGRRAVVVGSGLGADAEYLSSRGFATTGFDIAATAVRLARERHPGSTVDYRVADLLDLPDDLRGAFDLVVEVFTVQALPDPPRAGAIAGVRSLVAEGGTLLAIQFRHDGSSPADEGPPFPLTRDTMLSFAADGLEPVQLEEMPPGERGPLWRCEYHRR
ncbi:MAG: class I SAM-dependent methyltransferase [Nocardioidaceae bacterium]|nr:class I SAM-dependent methyltransferase [Nocardioidaceae bacterium]NUS51457.1 class I SAM-dependent methyltransferase [Nocardioidaceae bacterium]